MLPLAIGAPSPNILPPMNMTPGNNTQQMQTKETAPMTDNKTSFEAHSLGLTASTSQFQQQQQFNRSYNNATAMQFGEQQPVYMQQNIMHSMPQVHMYPNVQQPQYGQQQYLSPQQPLYGKPSNIVGMPNQFQPSPLQKRVQGYQQQQYYGNQE